MRGLIPGLESPHPLGPELPALFQEDDFALRFTSAFDRSLAPIFATLDNLDSYLDPGIAPGDFLEWLAGWVGLALDETWSEAQRRDLVARAVELYRWRGTVRGLADQVAVFTGSPPEIEENGGVSWSATPGAEPPGQAEPRLLVRVRVTDPDTVDLRRLEAVVAAAKPAHLAHEIEVAKR
jgi:phage tail-like protein